MRVRAGLVNVIYSKALVLSNDERSSRASGDIVNLMSVDATRLQDLCTYGLIAISGPLQVIIDMFICRTNGRIACRFPSHSYPSTIFWDGQLSLELES